MRMRTMMSLSGLLLLMGSFGIAQQQQHDNNACKFSVQGDPVRATVTGPEDIVPLVYVVEQPDSPVEIVSVDLEGMWLSVSGEQHAERACSQYKVHNRSDRIIQRVEIELSVGGTGGAGGTEQLVRRRSHLAKPSRLRVAVEVAMVEPREIT